MDSVLGQLPQPIPYVSIRIQYSGAPGSMMAEVSSVEQQKDLVMDAKVQNEANGWAGSGANPWHLDKDTESYAFLTNMGEKPARIGFKVWANGQIYHLERLQLVPHETRMIDLRKLRDAQETDLGKQTIPAGATDGSVLWMRLDNVPVMGRFAVVTRHGGVASSYDCTLCQCPAVFNGTTNVVPGTACPLPVPNTDQLSAQAWFVPECGGSAYPYDLTDVSAWDSTNTSVFTVSNSSPIGLLRAVGGGFASAQSLASNQCTTYTLNGYTCQCTNNSMANGSTSCGVQVPTSLSIVAGTNSATSEAPCTTHGGLSGCGLTRTFKYQVNDQNGQPISVPNTAVGDVICNTSTNALNLQFYTTTCGGMTGSCWGAAGPCGKFTDPNGQFPDSIPLCAPACISSGTCCTAGQTIAKQTWTVNGQTLSSDVKSQTYQCNKILVNGN